MSGRTSRRISATLRSSGKLLNSPGGRAARRCWQMAQAPPTDRSDAGDYSSVGSRVL